MPPWLVDRRKRGIGADRVNSDPDRGLNRRPERAARADLHSPWRRPVNENTIGLSQESLPKGMDCSGLSQRHLTQVARAPHIRSRKCPGLLTQEEVISIEIVQLHNPIALRTWNRQAKIICLDRLARW